MSNLNEQQFNPTTKQGRLFNIKDHGGGFTSYHQPGTSGGAGGILDHSDPSADAHQPARFGGEDFKYSAGSPEAAHISGGSSLRNTIYDRDSRDKNDRFFESIGADPVSHPAHKPGDVIGWENPEAKFKTDMKANDLSWNDRRASSGMPGYGHANLMDDDDDDYYGDDDPNETVTTATTPKGEPVGRVRWSRDDDGNAKVHTAEIAKIYQGHGLSHPAIGSFLEHVKTGGVYADGFTDAGAGAFHKKGIPLQGEEYDEDTNDYTPRYEDVDPDAQRAQFKSPDATKPEQAPGGFRDRRLPGMG